MGTKQIPLFGIAKPQIDLVIDVANIAQRAAHRFAELTHRGEPTGHVYGTINMLGALFRHYSEKYEPRLVFALEGNCRWRREILPEYKQNRGSRSTKFTGKLGDVHALINLLPGITVQAEGEEADDVIAAHCASFPSKQHVIYSTDRDLWQLCHNHLVRVIRATKDKPVSVYDIAEDFYTTNPRLVPLAKAIIGDTSDNIPGVKGFLREDLKKIFDTMSGPDVDEMLSVTTKLAQNGKIKQRSLGLLTDNVDHVRKMLSVATLRRDCKFTNRTNNHDMKELADKLEAAACSSLVAKLPAFYGGKV